MAELFIAREGFRTSRRGRSVSVQPGDIAEEGSWPLTVAPGSFQPLDVRFPAPAVKASPKRKSDSGDGDK